ncbi:tetratricopeptide repeat protein [Joostella sp. CR20]|uniref:tetratricopeptide repeat protein n=1 Tax=Joostella sp. CR20 TaxID=2804312 RepID=UPI00313E366E
MERLLKFCLSGLFIISLSCTTSDFNNLSTEERKELAKEKWEANNTYQGSPASQTLFDEIIALDSLHCDAVREKSVPYLKRGMAFEWKPLFDNAVACNPKVWQPMRGYLYLYFYRDFKRAIKDFNASDILTPNFVDAPQGHSVNYWRGIAYIGLEDYANAIVFFEKHINTELETLTEDWIEPSAFLYLGIAQYELGNLQDAEVNFKKMLKYNREQSADANYYLALLNYKLGDKTTALKHVEKAIADYKSGIFRYRDYVEEIRQIYPQQLESLKAELL